MAISDHKLTDEERKTLGVAALAVRPQMSAKNLKEWFDQLACRIATLHNDTIDDLKQIEDNYTIWQDNEQLRRAAEIGRVQAENARMQAEALRLTGEAARQSAEAMRQDLESGMVARAEAAALRAEAIAGGDLVTTPVLDMREKKLLQRIERLQTTLCAMDEEDNRTLCTGRIMNAGAGWNTFFFPTIFARPPQVLIEAIGYDGAVLIKDVMTDRFLYCLSRREWALEGALAVTKIDTFTLSAPSFGASGVAQTLVTNVALGTLRIKEHAITTKDPIILHYLAIEDGEIAGTE